MYIYYVACNFTCKVPVNITGDEEAQTVSTHEGNEQSKKNNEEVYWVVSILNLLHNDGTYSHVSVFSMCVCVCTTCTLQLYC